MKQPVMHQPDLSDSELEDLAVTALLYRHSARRSCALAGFMRWADPQRARWLVKDAARLMARSAEIDGVGADGAAS
jgi:hypothetical protein